MRFVFFFMIAVFLAVPVLAQEGGDAIIIINKDGTVTEFSIPGMETPVPEDDRQETSSEDSPPTVDTASERPAPPKPSVKKEAPSPKRTPPKPPSVKGPTKEESIGRVVKPAPAPVQEGAKIDKDAALRIALEIAPPARRFLVSRRTYQDRPVFQVTFFTENGPHDILIDSETGEILKR